jgi:O-antigen ligase
MIEARLAQLPRWLLVSIAIGAWAGFVALSPSLASAGLRTAPVILAAAACWVLAEPHRWIAAFLAAAVLLPPLPISLGDSGPHPSLLFAVLGIFAGAIYIRQWRITADRLTRALLCLFSALLASAALAGFYSGAALGMQTLARVLLFGVGVYVFFYASSVRPADGAPSLRMLFWLAVLSGAFACVDFYFQLPAPAGFGAQFIWTDTGVYRRAQGIFYEASTLGNFCVFFLVMSAVAFTRSRDVMPISRYGLVLGSIILSAALIFSYSRASILNLLVALAALAWLDRARIRWRKASMLLGISLTAGAAASYYLLPDIAAASWARFYDSFRYFFDYTEPIFSGRFESWRVLLRFLAEHPWHAVFGIGYKTLPYSDYIGQTVVADNMYLSMLVETGILGLASLVWLNAAILRASRRAARNKNLNTSFFGTWMFCFWLGQSFQMLSADLLTYWRVLPLYFLVLAWAVREANQAPAQ